MTVIPMPHLTEKSDYYAVARKTALLTMAATFLLFTLVPTTEGVFWCLVNPLTVLASLHVAFRRGQLFGVYNAPQTPWFFWTNLGCAAGLLALGFALEASRPFLAVTPALSFIAAALALQYWVPVSSLYRLAGRQYRMTEQVLTFPLAYRFRDRRWLPETANAAAQEVAAARQSCREYAGQLRIYFPELVRWDDLALVRAWRTWSTYWFSESDHRPVRDLRFLYYLAMAQEQDSPQVALASDQEQAQQALRQWVGMYTIYQFAADPIPSPEQDLPR